MGFRRFSFRGLKKVEAEWILVCLALERGHLRPLDRRRDRSRNSSAANGVFESTRTPSRSRARVRYHCKVVSWGVPIGCVDKSVTPSQCCVEHAFLSVQ